MKAVQLIMQLFYAIVLFSAANATTGTLAAACFVGALLNTVSIVCLLVAWGIMSAVKENR